MKILYSGKKTDFKQNYCRLQAFEAWSGDYLCHGNEQFNRVFFLLLPKGKKYLPSEMDIRYSGEKFISN